MAYITLILVGVGILLIILGCYVSLADWNRRNRTPPPAPGGVVTEATGLPEVLSGLAKLADALKGHPLGMQLIIAGITVLAIAGLFGGIGQLANSTH